MRTIVKIMIIILAGSMACPSFAARFLFDASCLPMAGDADWVIDAVVPDFILNGQSDPQRFPSPDSCTIGANTPETYWTGGYSAWGIELVKSGHWVETIPRNATLTYGDCQNTQDLSFYDVLVIPEPQLRYSDAESEAIRNFVADGGGLFMVANHCGSDRIGNDYDSSRVFLEMQAPLYFGIEFERDPDHQVHDYCDWDELNNRNFIEDLNDPIIHGPYGDVRAIGFHSATNIILHPENNSTVQAHAWRNDTPHTDINVTVATSEYGNGRIAAIGDSAPADDGTGDPRDNLANGWSHYTTSNDKLFMNMSHWLTFPDVAPLPTRTPCPNATPFPHCEGTATPSAPTITPTPVYTPSLDPIVDISTSQIFYSAGDWFELKLDIENPGSSRSVNLYIILQVANYFYFYPAWTEEPGYQRRYLSQGGATSEYIFQFTWPDAGRLDGLIFWAALLDPTSNELVGNYDYASFGSI
jgi:hypothetical protein